MRVAVSIGRGLAAAVVFGLSVGLADAAGPFDGEWSGGSPGAAGAPSARGSRPCAPTSATVKVANGKLSGTYTFAGSSFTSKITGAVAKDGTVKGKWGTNEILNGKFSGDHFSGRYKSADCGVERNIALEKVR